MVGGEGGLHHGADGEFAVANDGDLLDAADGEDRGVGRVDDGGEALHVEHAHVADAERGGAVLLVAEGAAVGAADEVLGGGGNLEQRFALAVADAGQDQAGFQGDGDADVHCAVDFQVVAAIEGIELGVLGQGQGAGLDHEVVDADAVVGVGGVVDIAAEGHGLAHVDLGGDVEVGRSALAVGGDAGDGLAHAAELDARIGGRGGRLGHGSGSRGCRRSRSRFGGGRLVALNVAFGDATVGSSTGYGREVDAAFAGQTARNGGGAHLAVG